MLATEGTPAERPEGPVRMCVICRQRFLKKHLLRHTRTEDGKLAPDPKQTAPGRGWYVCGEPSCRERFARFRPAPRRPGRKRR